MIENYRLGASEEHVVEHTLSYYEMGVLVREYDITDMAHSARDDDSLPNFRGYGGI